jgi:hypothetical protein
MLDLGSPRWKELSHAYGPAQDILGALAIFRGPVALGNMLLDFDGDCQCPNCDTVFPALGYDILKQK